MSFAGEDLSQKRPIVAVVATGELRKIQGKPAKEQGVEIRLDSSDSQELPAAALVAPTETGQLPSGMLAPPCGLPGAIQEYLDAHNQDPRPYVWTATAESILTKVARGRIALEKIS